MKMSEIMPLTVTENMKFYIISPPTLNFTKMHQELTFTIQVWLNVYSTLALLLYGMWIYWQKVLI